MKKATGPASGQRGVAFAAMGTAGQRCTTLRRLFVHESVYDDLVPRLRKAYESVSVGNPLETGALVDRVELHEGRARAVVYLRDGQPVRATARGEVVQAIPGFEFHVLDADPRRVKRVRIVQGRAADRRRARMVTRDEPLPPPAEVKAPEKQSA